MNDGLQRRAREVFLELSTLNGPAVSAELERLVAGDRALRDAVVSLLDARANADQAGVMTTPTAASPAGPITESSGSIIGRYKLLQPIGEGGFGSVFLAEQTRPVRRRVAMKIIKLGMDTKQVIARFEAERQALALMDHPHIARVFDAGATDTGQPYFAMEYVVGDAITKFADAYRLDIPSRLALFAQVCSAVQHAHTKGVIHRDLKPANVLVSMVDGRPFAKVIDFGIAKATASPLTDKTLFTEHRQLIGTPEYMSPEQADGSPDIDTRTDVYALGVLLYELLTGTTPFDAARLRSAAWAEMQRIIREEEPPAPSLRLSREASTLASTAGTRRLDPAKLRATVRGELDWVVMKALDKDRARRYDTPAHLASDIERHLIGEPVQAAPPSRAYKAKKFVRRNKGPVIAGGAVATALLVGLAATAWSLTIAKRAGAEAERQAVVAGQNADAAQLAQLRAEELREQEAAQRAAAEEARARADQAALESRHSSLVSQALYLRQQERYTEALTVLDEAYRLRPGWDSMLVSGQLYERCRDTWQLTNVIDVGAPPHAMCLTQYGARLVCAVGQEFRLYATHSSGALLRKAPAPLGIRELRALRGDTGRVLVLGGDWLSILSLEDLTIVATLRLENESIVAVDSSLDEVVVATSGRRVIVYAKEGLTETDSRDFPAEAMMRDEQEIRALAISPDGRWVVSGGRTFTNDRMFWDRAAQRVFVRTIHANLFSFCADDTLVTIGNQLGTPGTAIQAVTLHPESEALGFHTTAIAEVPPEHGSVAEVSATGGVISLAMATRSGLATLVGFSGETDGRRRLATDRFSSIVGRTTASVGVVAVEPLCQAAAFAMGSHVAVCRRVRNEGGWILPYCLNDRVYHIYNDDANGLAVRVTDASPEEREIASASLPAFPDGEDGWPVTGFDAVVSADERTIAVRFAETPWATYSAAPRNERVRVYRDLEPGTARPVGRPALDIVAPASSNPSTAGLQRGGGLLELSPDGSRLLLGARLIPDARTTLFDTNDGSVVAQWDEEKPLGMRATSVPGKPYFACTSPGSEAINLHSWATGEIVRSIPLASRQVGNFCVSDDGRHIAVSIAGSRIEVFSVETGDLVRSLDTNLDPLAWSSAGDVFMGYKFNPQEGSGDIVLAEQESAAEIGVIALSRSRGGNFGFLAGGEALAYNTPRHAGVRPMSIIWKRPPAEVARSLGRGVIDGAELPVDLEPDPEASSADSPRTTSWLTERIGSRVRLSGIVAKADPTRSGGHWTIYLAPEADGLMVFVRSAHVERFERMTGVAMADLVGLQVEIEGELEVYAGYSAHLSGRVQIAFDEDAEVAPKAGSTAGDGG